MYRIYFYLIRRICYLKYFEKYRVGLFWKEEKIAYVLFFSFRGDISGMSLINDLIVTSFDLIIRLIDSSIKLEVFLFVLKIFKFVRYLVRCLVCFSK